MPTSLCAVVMDEGGGFGQQFWLHLKFCDLSQAHREHVGKNLHFQRARGFKDLSFFGKLAQSRNQKDLGITQSCHPAQVPPCLNLSVLSG
jgi:hypothetical protein